MASIENRSHYQVTVKNREDLTKTFAHNSRSKAEQYCQSLDSQPLHMLKEPPRFNWLPQSGINLSAPSSNPAAKACA
jgi:hypothetical protein